MFLKVDENRAQNELECFHYCADLAEKEFKKENYAKSAAYYEDATRSLYALERMQETKRKVDQTWFEIKQAEGQMAIDKMIHEMRGTS
ncbi:hypothetical protein J2Z83_003784 [Virgibacillus natechei]|uniref:DUF2508 family protein n=1 Tax=Virgibacillus natechei TaxID=1216297 RepID=A0ABS4IL80_9BACI|nr:hypothetical protein [Virgibacillus natechei]MBP1971633.1 hypothetical protein [Virgibacillus natechei]UZD13041.1 hypothetical protein OLD84_00230 [Virgibacillus natechei]